MLLTGKAVVITGAGRGIGAACAKGAARQGAAVVVNDIDVDEANATVDAIRATGAAAIACVADITDWDESHRLIQSCVDAFGKIDGLVNNAGLFHRQRLDACDPRAARALIDVNIVGSLYCASHAVKPMLAQGSGSIVNLTSDAHMGMPTLGVYGATKGAVASMVYSWALELAGTGVRVNAVSPSGATRMVLMSLDDEAEARKRHSMFPAPEANSPAVEYLLSDRAADVNGQLLRMQGERLYLYTHPALLSPPAVRATWTAEQVADAFANEFKGRQVPCGNNLGMETLPIKLESGFTRRRNLD